ncbi:MAG: FHA domain-containing protein [Chloroflexi bacterium]|nr:MAG: FHA domain-containing protein [Chloroflexota bacterium]
MKSKGKLAIHINNFGGATFVVTAPDVEGRIIGRSGNQDGFMPDIDLNDYGAREAGVSRRHAVLVNYGGDVHIIDLDSVNGTFINGERLMPNQPYRFDQGDQISIGNLVLQIEPLAEK